MLHLVFSNAFGKAKLSYKLQYIYCVIDEAKIRTRGYYMVGLCFGLFIGQAVGEPNKERDR